jgi:hypothetical protein
MATATTAPAISATPGDFLLALGTELLLGLAGG